MTVEKELFAYLTENPHAEDSVEGVKRWSLHRSDRHATSIMGRALDELVSTRFLAARERADGHIYHSAHLGY